LTHQRTCGVALGIIGVLCALGAACQYDGAAPAAGAGAPNTAEPTAAAPSPTPATAGVLGQCPVTRPDPSLRAPREISDYTNPPTGWWWYGNDAQWVILPTDGILVTYYSAQRPPKGTETGTKMMWWRVSRGQLTIRGRRLDGSSPPLEADIPTGYGESGFQATGLKFPTDGCWEIIGTVAGEDLRFVLSVRPPVPLGS